MAIKRNAGEPKRVQGDRGESNISNCEPVTFVPPSPIYLMLALCKLFTSLMTSSCFLVPHLSHETNCTTKETNAVIEFVHVEKTIEDRKKILIAWYFVYMSDRMSVSLNWERLRVVGVKKKGEELSREETTNGEIQR